MSQAFARPATSELAEPNPTVGLLAGPLSMFRNVRIHSHLLWNLIQRDIRLKYRESALGYLWSLLEPLLLSAVYYVLFTLLRDGLPREYPLLVIVGVITWGFFSRGVNMSVTCLTKNEGLIKQVFFPREIFAITPVMAQLIMASLSLLIAIPAMIYYGIAPTFGLLMVPVGLVLTAMLALGIGLSMACINVVNRDIEHLFRFITRAGLYISPVIWTLDTISPAKASALSVNPMVVPLTMIRNGIAGKDLGVSTSLIVYSAAVCAAAFLVGAIVFKRFEATVVKKL